MRYLLILLMYASCTRNRDKHDHMVKTLQDSVIYIGGGVPMGSYESISDSSFIRHLQTYLKDTARYTTDIGEYSIVYMFNDSSLY